MLTIDCKDVVSIRNELLVYVSDQVAAIPTLKNHQFTLSMFDDDDKIDLNTVILSIKEFLDSIGEGRNFAVISNNDVITIKSIHGTSIEREPALPAELFSCTHCGFVSPYEVEYQNHMKIHYL